MMIVLRPSVSRSPSGQPNTFVIIVSDGENARRGDCEAELAAAMIFLNKNAMIQDEGPESSRSFLFTGK